MSADVKLVYDPTCPHVSEARKALLQAFAIAGLPACWTEWRTDAPETPERLRRLPSPTILVRGRDIAGTGTAAIGPCCRLHGERSSVALSSGEIAKRLKARGWLEIGGMASGASGAMTLLLPAGLCPGCWPAYAAVLSSLGAGFLLETSYQAPIAVALFVVGVASHSYHVRRTGRYTTLLLALAGAFTALAGKFILGAPAVQYIGLFTFVLSAVWAAAYSAPQRNANSRHPLTNQDLEDCYGCKEKS